jgi:myo-inositol-1(or 4)-monophosphatase
VSPSDLGLALDAARGAGDVIMGFFRTETEVRHKAPDQPVTAADLAADALLERTLLRARPSDGWLSEETVDRPDRLEARRVWVVDPLDGTRSFVRGYPEFAVSVALVEDGVAVVGVVYNPARAEVFWATRGGGAFRATGWAGGEAPGEPLRLSADIGPGRPGGGRPSLLASRTEIRGGELEPFEVAWAVEPLGSTAYKMAHVAAGLGDAFVSLGPKSEWDVAAGALILEEAGGVATDVSGARLRYNRPDPYVHGIVCAAPGLHGMLLEWIAGLSMPRLRAQADGRREED